MLRRFHIGAAIFWALMALPTILWFRGSILYVAFMSLYANLAAEMSAYQGARAEDSNNQETDVATIDEKKLTDIIDEYSHACPDCTGTDREWVVLVEDVMSIVQRAISEAMRE